MALTFSKYPGVYLERELPNHLYRNNDCYGEGQFNIVDIMVYEITELNNTDILEYCSEHYDFTEALNRKIHAIIDSIANDEFGCTDEEIKNVEYVCTEIINSIQELTNVYVQYGLWLCSKEAVYDLYDGQPGNIKAYPTSDIVLADLGYDGILFGYTHIPRAIDEE